MRGGELFGEVHFLATEIAEAANTEKIFTIDTTLHILSPVFV
jgi:hypothetical protein